MIEYLVGGDLMKCGLKYQCATVKEFVLPYSSTLNAFSTDIVFDTLIDDEIPGATERVNHKLLGLSIKL